MDNALCEGEKDVAEWYSKTAYDYEEVYAIAYNRYCIPDDHVDISHRRPCGISTLRCPGYPPFVQSSPLSCQQ